MNVVLGRNTKETNGIFDEKFRIVNVNDRDIYFTGAMNSKSMFDLVEELEHCEQKSINTLNIVKGEITATPIKLHINSSGGSIFDVLVAVEEIKSLRVPVHTIVSGIAANAATVLSCAGTKRFITKNAHMFIYEIRSGCWGKKSEIEEHFENMSHLSNLLINYYKDHTKMSEDDLKEILKHDYYGDAQTCLEKGLVDEIL